MASSVVARLAVILAICLWFVWSVSTNENNIPVWTWLDGTTLVNQPSTLTAGNQYPGCRADSGLWTPPTTGVVWMFGGREGSGTALNDLWLYDMPSQEWTYVKRGKEQSWPKPRYGAAVCGVTNSSVVVYGGAQSTENLLSDTWLYHLHNQSWVLLSEGSQPGVGANMVHWCTRNALWIYGDTSSNPNIPQTMWKFSFQSYMYEWTKFGASTRNRGSPEEFSHLGRLKTATWVVNNTQLYILGRNPSLDSKSCQRKTSEVKNKCDLWRYSSLSDEWEHISMDVNEQAGIGEQPRCLANAASWPDASGNLWLLDSSDESDSTCEKTSQPGSNLWMLDLRLMRWISFQTNSPGSKDVFDEQSKEAHNQPPPRAYCASWSWNNSHYLFGGLVRNGSVGALNDLWDFRLMEVESLRQPLSHSLAVPPVAVFFLSLGALGILSLLVFAVIFFTKCSAGPRLKPPNHFGDKIRYSPVEMDEVLFT